MAQYLGMMRIAFWTVDA